MNRINWKVRVKNVYFWITIISAIFVLLATVLPLFGIDADLETAEDKITAIIRAVFSALAAIGVINDPTTAGLNDSNQAMTYDHPKTSQDETQQIIEEEVANFLEQEEQSDDQSGVSSET